MQSKHIERAPGDRDDDPYPECRHFDPFDAFDDQAECGAGVLYGAVRDAGGLPCVLQNHTFYGNSASPTATCPKRKFVTNDQAFKEALAAQDEFERRVEQAEGWLEEGRCPECGKPMLEQVLVGSCLYASPCGHRLGMADMEQFEKERTQWQTF